MNSLLFKEEYETCFLHHLDQVRISSQSMCRSCVHIYPACTARVKIDNESPE